MEPPSVDAAREESLEYLTSSPAQAIEEEEPKKPGPSAAALGRSGTLSWQRRPQSGSIRRPLSVASGSADRLTLASPSGTSTPPSPERPASRAQIAQSLGAKDPTWFRQTSDRGIGSAAYRKNQEDAADAGSMASKRQLLPGMSRESTAEPEATSPPPESTESSNPIRSSTVLGKPFSPKTSSGGDRELAPKVTSPLPQLDSQKFAPPSDHGSSVDGGDRGGSMRGLAMSPTQGRISPERPVSPTKGMGGFVQSAMLKRSDSVSKRWSAQAPPGLSRQNSTLSNRGSTYATLSKPDSRPTSLSRDNSTEPTSRPGSSSANLAMTRDAADATQKPEFVKPALPHHSRSKSVASTFSEDHRQQDEASPPSPSKRWSPTKSSWLESALNKPESPKVKQQPVQQPAWMSEISRIKQQRGSIDLGKGNPLQSPPANTSTSGRSSPIKEVQLRPVSLRDRPTTPRTDDAPMAEKTTKPVQPPLKPKPAVAPKPTLPTKEEVEVEAKPAEEPVPAMEKPEPSNDIPSSTDTKADASASRLAKEPPLPPPAVKPKPETPPKKDFRANLKSRQPVSDATKKDEVNEFQNVFGKLKRTETKNYVAPDTLKDNILRGKGALNITGGPKPSVRRDEFRDSLVIQKAAMLAKAQETGSAALQRRDSSAKDAPAPEAIAARGRLGRSDSISQLPPPKERESTPEAIAARGRLGRSDSISKIPPPKEKESIPDASFLRQSLRASKPPVAEKPTLPAASLPTQEPAKSSKLAGRFNPALANILARGPPPLATNSGASSKDASEDTVKPIQEEKSGPAPELTHMTKGRARGPKRRAPGAKQATTKTEDPPRKVGKAPITATTPATTVPLVKTEHILPSSEPSDITKDQQEILGTRTPARNSLKEKPATPAKSPDLSRRLSKSPTPEPPKKPASLELGRSISNESRTTPQKSPFSASAQPPRPLPSPSATKQPLPAMSKALPAPPPKPAAGSQALKEIGLPNKDAPKKDEISPSKLSFSVKSAAALWSGQTTSSVPNKPKSPIKLPTRADEQTAMEKAGLAEPSEPLETLKPEPLAPKPKPIGLGLGRLGGLVAARSRESSPPKPYSAKVSPISPPMTGNRPQSEPFKGSPAPEKPAGVFTDFFDEAPITTGELSGDIDTVRILKTSPFDSRSNGNFRTLSKKIHEITEDGKLLSIPIQEENILFQDSMYLCTHVYGDSNNTISTEVYLWSGKGVAEPTVEDVQLFAKNYAKQNQAKLIGLRQGKEIPSFLDALGGIVITRRGVTPGDKKFILCGRRHLGRLVFDELDFSLKAFCSGYVYIVTTGTGKVYLWKGRGCSAEELMGARVGIMGMDLAPGGDFREVDEGKEPAEFLSLFSPIDGSAPTIPRSADHWRYKGSLDQYRTRLFKIEQQQSSGWGSLQASSYLPAVLRRPSWQFSRSSSVEPEHAPTPPRSPLPPGTSTKVVEIAPYCQQDLEPEHIYVLDAFFDIYM